MSGRARPSNSVEATEQAQAEKTGGDRQDLRLLSDAADPAALKSATFSAPASATSGLQGYDLEGAGGQYSKAEAGYTDGPDKDEPCIHCTMFGRPNRCTLVRGDISARGHCKHFSAKAEKLLSIVDAPVCAGVAFTSPAGRVLFLKRSDDSDHGGSWCFPGGHVEEGETLEQAAARECVEEIGFLPGGDREPCAHVVIDGEVDFTTFRQAVDAEFEPKLNAEHTDFVWAPFNEAPQPVHPWVKAAMPLIESGAAKVAKAAKRTLYVHRPLTNVDDFTAWAKAQGFGSVLVDPHVTIAWSKDKLDWSAAGDTFDTITVPAAADQKNGKRSVIPLGDKGAVVLRFESTDLQERWQQFRDAGASWDHENFKPHVTITFDGADVDLSKVEPWTGVLEFGPEVFAPINDKWQTTITEKATGTAFDLEQLLKDGAADVPRDDKGRWTGSGGQGSAERLPQDSYRETVSALRNLGNESMGANTLTESERAAVEKYTGDNYATINSGLRNENRISEQVKQLDSAISKSTLPQSVIVYRGVGNTLSKQLAKSWDESKAAKFTDKAFVSTSANRDSAIGFSKNMVEITVPSGTKALAFPDKGEAEILLGRGHTFIVTSIHKTPTGYRRIKAELIS